MAFSEISLRKLGPEAFVCAVYSIHEPSGKGCFRGVSFGAQPEQEGPASVPAAQQAADMSLAGAPPLGPLLPQPAFPQPSPEPSSGLERKGVWKESLPPNRSAHAFIWTR